jgi:hypothetical protein
MSLARNTPSLRAPVGYACRQPYQPYTPGAPLVSTANVHSVQDLTDAAGVLAVDLPCHMCAYNLRGLMPSGGCPECGASVALSLRGDLLRFCEPAWLERLARGARCAFVAILLSFVIGGLGLIVWIYGAWLITSPDPSGLGEHRYGLARRMARFSLLIYVGGTVLLLPLSVTTPSMVVARAAMALAPVLSIVILVGHFAMLSYLMRIAARIPDAALARQARVLLYASGISMAAAMVAIVGLIVGGWIWGQHVLVAALVLILPALLAALVLAILYMVLLHRLSQTFGQQAGLAREYWEDHIVLQEAQ